MPVSPVLIGVGVGAFILLMIPIVIYNRLVNIRNQCTEAWSNVDTELLRRHDLIPNLVATVQGYAQHERALLQEVARLRAACSSNHGSPKERAPMENQLTGALGQLMVRCEAYPDLKANENFLALQQELTNTEDRIQAARRFYNGNVRENNNLVQMFPSNLVAGLFHFELRQFFELKDASERQPVAVRL